MTELNALTAAPTEDFARRRPGTESPTYSESAMAQEFRKPPMQLIDVGQSRLAYRRFGHGPDVVFVHGWPLHSATFRRILPALARDYTCHLLDLPMAGWSEWSEDTPSSLTAYAESVTRAIDALDLQRFAVVSHDSGSVIARLAVANDERVHALVISGTELPGHRPWLVEFYARAFRLPGALSVLRPILATRLLRRSPLAFGGCFANRDYLDTEFHEFFVEPLLTSQRTLWGQSKLLRELDWSIIDGLDAVHERIRCPVRLIWGERDPFFPVSEAQRTLPQFRGGAELDVIPGGKLFVHEEFPDQFAALTHRFLKSRFPEG